MPPLKSAIGKLNIAIIGCGWVADWHVRDGLALLPEKFSLIACCDLDEVRRKKFAEIYNIPRQCESLNEVLQMPDIDVVIIATPPAAHYDMLIATLSADKHAICEKPFASSLSKVDSVRSVESKSRGRVMPIFQYRFGDGVARVRHVIKSGLAGKHYLATIETAKTRGPDYYKVAWRGKFATELGGVLLTQAIHIHDLLLWLVGPVAEATCFKTTRVNPIEVEDCAVASLVMADGSLASLSATLGSARQVTRLRLCFENVTFEKQAFDDDSSHPGNEPWTTIPKTEAIGLKIAQKMADVTPQREWFSRQYELFHEAIANGAPFPVTLDDARSSIELITGLFSANETRASVIFPIGPEHPMYEGWIPAKYI